MIIAHVCEGHPRICRRRGSVYEHSQLQLCNVVIFQEQGIASNSFGLARIDT